MTAVIEQELSHFMEGLKKRNPGETEFHQAVQEVAESLMPYILDHSKYKDARILIEL
jgi:glutamate dehydrogenase (NADP+)